VIGNCLYLFDSGRGKWLSVESSTFNFGKDTWAGDDYLEYAGDIDESGPQMPRNGTVVYATFNTTNGDPTHSGAIKIIDTTSDPEIEVSSTPMVLEEGTRVYDNLNIDFDAGDKIRIYIDPSAWGVENPSVVLWIKWRS